MSRKYADWFGDGDTEEDVQEMVELYGTPERLYYGRFMAALVYPDKVVCVGYDGNEYQYMFILDEPAEPPSK